MLIPTALSGIDAIGFNVKDNYVYGLAQNGIVRGDLIRIGAGGASQTVASGIAPSIFNGVASFTFQSGDVDETGTYWALTNAITVAGVVGQYYMTIDLSDPTVTNNGSAAAPVPILDWAYVQGGGNALYALGNAGGSTALLRFDRALRTWSTVHNYGAVGTTTNAWGALFATSSGNLYGVDQGTGQIYSFAVTAAIAALAAVPPETPEAPVLISKTSVLLTQVTAIDGARCATQPDPGPQ